MSTYTEQPGHAGRPTREQTLALISTTEATARLGVSCGSISRLARSGQMPALRPGTDHCSVLADVARPARTCPQHGMSLIDRPPNARFCLACYRTRKQAAAHCARREAGRFPGYAPRGLLGRFHVRGSCGMPAAEELRRQHTLTERQLAKRASVDLSLEDRKRLARPHAVDPDDP